MKLYLSGDGTASTPSLQNAAQALGAELRILAGPAELAAAAPHADGVVIDLDAERWSVPAIEQLPGLRSAPVVAVSAHLDRGQVRRLFAAGVRDVVAMPAHKRELVLRLSALARRKARIACIGGGTGLYTVLSGLKEAPDVLLSSIVTMSDDGGSSGRLRTSFGVLPPGDVRRSLVALSNAPEVMSYVMQYRFDRGEGLDGHSLGNLLLTALCELGGGMQWAVKALGDVLNVTGLIMCATERSTTLCAELEDGSTVRGESAIDRCDGRSPELRIRRVWHEPPGETSIDAVASLLGADLIVIGPGDLYTSTVSGLIVHGIAEAVRASRGKRVYVANLMTKPGETWGFDVVDHVAAVVSALGGDALDYVLQSSSALQPDAVRTYASLSQVPVVAVTAERLRAVSRAECIAADIADGAALVRHDSAKVGAELLRLLRSTAT